MARASLLRCGLLGGVLVGLTVGVTACGTEAARAGSELPTTTIAPTTAASPSTTALAPCPVDAPAWAPTVLPDGMVLLEGSSARSELPGAGSGTVAQTLVSVGADGEIGKAVIVSGFSSAGSLQEPDATVRGQPASLGPGTVDRGGSTIGDSTAVWDEAGREWRAVGYGLGPDELASTLGRLVLKDGLLTDTSDEFVELGRVVGAGSRMTYLAAGAPGQEPTTPSVTVRVLDDRGGGSGLPEAYGSLVGATRTGLDGRDAVVQQFEDGNATVLTTTADGAAVSVWGTLGVDDLSDIAASIERVEPGDPRLEGMLLGGPSSPEPVCG